MKNNKQHGVIKQEDGSPEMDHLGLALFVREKVLNDQRYEGKEKKCKSSLRTW